MNYECDGKEVSPSDCIEGVYDAFYLIFSHVYNKEFIYV